jgi:hypothetical protein
LGQFLGSSAGLSTPVIVKLTETWKTEQRTFCGRDLSGMDYAMAFKLIESAQARWPAVNAPHLVALVRAGARFEVPVG